MWFANDLEFVGIPSPQFPHTMARLDKYTHCVGCIQIGPSKNWLIVDKSTRFSAFYDLPKGITANQPFNILNRYNFNESINSNQQQMINFRPLTFPISNYYNLRQFYSTIWMLFDRFENGEEVIEEAKTFLTAKGILLTFCHCSSMELSISLSTSSSICISYLMKAFHSLSDLHRLNVALFPYLVSVKTSGLSPHSALLTLILFFQMRSYLVL